VVPRPRLQLQLPTLWAAAGAMRPEAMQPVEASTTVRRGMGAGAGAGAGAGGDSEEEGEAEAGGDGSGGVFGGGASANAGAGAAAAAGASESKGGIGVGPVVEPTDLSGNLTDAERAAMWVASNKARMYQAEVDAAAARQALLDGMEEEERAEYLAAEAAKAAHAAKQDRVLKRQMKAYKTRGGNPLKKRGRGRGGRGR